MSEFGVYLHVPFCTTRCGYCDFNTYTAGELGTSASQASYLDAIEKELELAAGEMEASGLDVSGASPSGASTVFVGGGTPSLLGADGLNRLLRAVRNTIGLEPGAEITTESNPESTSPEFFAGIRDAGFTRVSLGMQSASAAVLRVLERRHTPGRAVAAAKEARAAGFEHVNLDMIYGTPTETDDDVRRTLDAVLSAGVDHVSAYSLIVEDGTAMSRKVRRGELPAPSEDVYAARYEMIAARLEDAGFAWYEVSNWALTGGECQHNLLYWRDANWWGAGPGAHSHLDGVRFFNVKHPARYASLLSDGHLPVADREELTAAERHTEKLMLGLRLREGVPMSLLDSRALPVLDGFVSRGLLQVSEGAGSGFSSGSEKRIHLTDAGRLLADGIITDLLVAEES